MAHRIPIPSLASFAPCPVERQGAKIAAYCPEIKSSPASVGVYAADPGSNGQMICRKSFFRVRAFARVCCHQRGSPLQRLYKEDAMCYKKSVSSSS